MASVKPFLNRNRIFPTQQEAVAEMIEVCKKIPNIRKIIIFGSSVTPECNPWSDIDIYFETEKEMNR
ncbi:Nucleotidyltransferase domain-containing protein [Selenomonas ruminantium]|uniref:Nucleotidyltransferase domain-containing protein n=1 Tax=Selenomonas ruminantium TaxID=971 RepID=A0A1I3EQA4_SELRU|nr:Nucleotidyltransferase domain-containing protein [Selenomonas ruminantium]